MENHDYAELGAPKSSKSKASKRTKEVKQNKVPNGTASLKRPPKKGQDADIRRTSSEYRPKESETLNRNSKNSDISESLEIATVYATIPRRSNSPKKQNEKSRGNGSVNHKNKSVQSHGKSSNMVVNNLNGPGRNDSKELQEKDLSRLYAVVNKREKASVKSGYNDVSLTHNIQPPEEEDFSELYAEVKKEPRKQRPRSGVILHENDDVGLETSNISRSVSKTSEKFTSEEFESSPYAEIGRGRTSYHGKENVGSFPRSGKRGSLSLSFRSFRSQKSDEGTESLHSNSLYNLIPEEPDKPMPDLELLEVAPPSLPPENSIEKGQDNLAFQTENANASTSVDVENFEDEGYKEAMRRRARVKKERESRKRLVRFLILITLFLLVVLLIVLGVVGYLLYVGGFFD